MSLSHQFIGVFNGQSERLQTVAPVNEWLLPDLFGPQARSAQLPSLPEADPGLTDHHREGPTRPVSGMEKTEDGGLEAGPGTALFELNGDEQQTSVHQKAMGARAADRRPTGVVKGTGRVDGSKGSNLAG